MEANSSADPPATEQVELISEKSDNLKDEIPSFHCDLSDAELVYKIYQAFLPGLASACVDNTTGGLFTSPGSVAANIRQEMLDFLTMRSETFVAETVLLEGGPEAGTSDHPFDIISDFVDDFASSKRNFFSRVSGWLLSEKREDNIDDFVQEMELNGFWLLGKREAVAQTLLKNVDFKNIFHCDKKFHSSEELSEHVAVCGFRHIICENEGCSYTFSANQKEKHDSMCPFKIIPCEQKCMASIMRREMDRHCITVCPMKLTNCPFYAVGCQAAIPSCLMEKHRVDDLHNHLLYILKGFHKEASVDDLKRRIEQLEMASTDNLVDARDARSLSSRVKNLEAKLEPLQITPPKAVKEETKETANEDVEEKTDSQETNAKSKDLEATVKNSESKAESVGVRKAEESKDAGETAAAEDFEAKLGNPEAVVRNSEAKIVSIEVRKGEESKDTGETAAVRDFEAKLESSEDSVKNKDSEKPGDSVSKDSEAKLEFVEVLKTKAGQDAGETAATKDFESKLGSPGVSTKNKDSEKAGETVAKEFEPELDFVDAVETAVKHPEAQPEAREGNNKSNGHEVKPQPSEASPTKQIGEKVPENSFKESGGKPEHSEPTEAI